MNKYFFRVGNFANNYGNENYIISEYDFNEMESIDTDAFQPIALSEEWLIKLGFIKLDQDPEINNNNYYSKDVNNQEKIQIIVENGVIKEIDLLFINNFAEKGWEPITNQTKFFYVHYLQNLILDHAKPGYPFRY